jgi:hypothetical protein
MIRGRPSPCTSRTDAFPDALAVAVALHLGEGRPDLQEGAACGSRCVHRRVDGPELDAPLFEPIDQRNEIVREPSEPIEIEDDKNVIAAQIVQAGGQAGALSLHS